MIIIDHSREYKESVHFIISSQLLNIWSLIYGYMRLQHLAGKSYTGTTLTTLTATREYFRNQEVKSTFAFVLDGLLVHTIKVKWRLNKWSIKIYGT